MVKIKNSYLTATDQFCGAGGTTTGVKAAGIEVKMALNHWKLAIETHNTNHPETDHDCTDVQACDPRRYPSTNMLFTSPECTNHSLAKGRKRKFQNQYKLFGKVDISAEEERSRATMWDVPRFAEFHDYEIVVVENVVDARYWRMWDAWLMAMHSLGYKHRCLYLNSMFFQPCPQSRDRVYVVFWKKGNKAPDLEFRPTAPCPSCGDREAYQSWKKPEKKWGKYNQQYVYRCSGCNKIVTPYYYCAFNIIDWSVPIQRIGDRKRPLAEKTINRIKYGLKKYGNAQMIVTGRYTSGIGCRVRAADQEPLPTQPGDASHFLLSCQFHWDRHDGKVVTGNVPYHTQTGRQDANLMMPPIQFHRGIRGGQLQTGELPISTQTTCQDASILVPPAIIELRGTGQSRSSTQPLSTLTAGGFNHGVLMIRNNGQSGANKMSDPIGTHTTTIQHGLLVGPTGQSLLTPESWNSFLSYYYGGSMVASGLNDAVGTMTGNDRAAITQSAPKVEDCYYRCIKAHEVQRAMAFGDDYVVLGNSRQKVKQLGNAVTPPVSKWIAEQCVKSLK